MIDWKKAARELRLRALAWERAHAAVVSGTCGECRHWQCLGRCDATDQVRERTQRAAYALRGEQCDLFARRG